jgi:hypothetical protein
MNADDLRDDLLSAFTDAPATLRPSSRRSLPNLMSSLAAVRGVSLPAPALTELADLSPARHQILLLADGVGQAQIERHLASGLLARQRVARLTSVFPSTTATAIGTVMSGLPPALHALTGWYIHYRELAETIAVLPLARRGQPGPAAEAVDWAARIFDVPALTDRLPLPVVHIAPQWIATSLFNRHFGGRAQCQPYADLAQMFALLGEALDAAREPTFFYVYWPEFDAVAHEHGPASAAAGACLAQFEAMLDRFATGHAGSGADLLMTADHGFLTTPPERLVELANFPELVASLAAPLSGERRVAWAHLQPGRGDGFQAAAQAALGDCAWVVPSRQLIADAWFGDPAAQHPELAARLGDFALIMKDDWTLRDQRPGDADYTLLGSHGGISRAEMEIPLARLTL